ncbi:MAG: TIR domain-containing protein [Methylomarinum sp.]|nr:TIR domain-containing protein [Methylomarinum sp.]
MNIFLSYSHQDQKYADLLFKHLSEAGHEVWQDKLNLKAGDNLIEKVNLGIKKAQTIIVIISKHSLQSKWVMHEVSALALGDLSSDNRRVIPVLIDSSSVPSYLSKYLYVDLSKGIDQGVQSLITALNEDDLINQRRTPTENENTQAIEALSLAHHDGRLTLVCGAGVSVGAGISSWNNLLLGLLEKMMASISNNENLSLKVSDANEFQKRYGSSALIIGKYLKSNLGKDFSSELRDALYQNNPDTSDIIEAVVELSRPKRDGKPLDSLITFNFDNLIEEALEKNRVTHKAIYTEGMRSKSSELPIYHVHGYLPRKGRILKDKDIVFSEDAYHSQFIDPFSWSNLIQLNKLSQNTCLFIGLSLTDPNLRRLLDVANRKNPNKFINHYIIKKTLSPKNGKDRVDDLAEFLEEQDANELGLNVIWVNEFKEIAPIVKSIGSA